MTCNVADEGQAAAMVERTVAEFGRLDMAYNNAGIFGPMGDLIDETAEAFDEVNAGNLRGVWTCMEHELLHMRPQGSVVDHHAPLQTEPDVYPAEASRPAPPRIRLTTRYQPAPNAALWQNHVLA